MSEEHLGHGTSLQGSLREISSHLAAMRATLDALTASLADHEARLRGVERWQHQATPLMSAVLFVLGVVVTVTLEHWL